MTLCKFSHVRISGMSVVVPEKEINIYDEAQYYDNSVKKIDRMRKMVGFYKRRVVDNGITAGDLAIQAAENLLQDMKIDKNSIDALVYVCQRRDFITPAVSFYIHHKLQLPNTVAVYDIQHGCPGWMYGLWNASGLIESRASKRILLLVADTPSAGMDLSNRISAPVFGDGGVATLLDYSETEIESYFDITTESQGYEAIMTPAGGSKCPLDLRQALDSPFNKPLVTPIRTPAGHETRLVSGYMDGLAVFNFTMNEVPKSILRVMDFAQVNADEIPYLVLHQANKQIVQTVAGASGFSMEKAPYHAFEYYGNNTMCSIPTCMSSALMDEIRNGKLTCVCSAFGNGLGIVSGVLTLDNVYMDGIKDYKMPEDHMTREEYIAYWTRKLSGLSE